MSAAYMRRCSRKQRHETESGAAAQRTALRAAYAIPKDALSVYRCDQCLGWHVGGTGGKFITRKRGKRPNKRMRGRM